MVIEAIYENGVFRPLNAVNVPEGTRVSVDLPDVPTHEADLPRVAVLTTWTRTQDTGWLRFAMDQFGVPYTLIAKDRVRAGNLRSDFDAIVMACMQKDPAQRPEHAAALLELLADIELRRPWTEALASAWWKEFRPASG